MNIEENGALRKMTVGDLSKLEAALDRISFLEEQQQNWRISSVARELNAENKRLRGVLEKIANLSTDQLASPEQCVAVVLAMDALSELPNAV